MTARDYLDLTVTAFAVFGSVNAVRYYFRGKMGLMRTIFASLSSAAIALFIATRVPWHGLGTVAVNLLVILVIVVLLSALNSLVEGKKAKTKSS